MKKINADLISKIRKNRRKSILILSAAIAFLVMSVIGYQVVTSSFLFADKSKKEDKNVYEMLELFGKSLEITKNYYVEDVSDEKLIEDAIDGMLSRRDPHSGFLNEEDYKEMQEHTEGKFGGLGIEVTMDKGVVKVISPIDDTPAYRAGLESGDYITHIDGEQVQGLTLSEAVKKMKGKPGTKIKLTVLREGEEPFDVEITRAIISTKAVKSKTFRESIGYLRISTFNENTSKELAEHIKKIKKKLKGKVKGYILDLRNNPGGLLTEAVGVSNTFLEQGEIVSVISKGEKPSRSSYAEKGDLTDGKPMVVLINGGSASASEIVSGALQDHRRAVIAGTKSYGKGSVQTIIPMDNKNVALKITTALYYTPSGKSIQAQGIEPDVEVKRVKIEEGEEEEEDRLFSEATLSNAIKNKNGKKKTKKAKKDKNDDNSEDKYKKDYQLQRGLDIVKALATYEESPTKEDLEKQKEENKKKIEEAKKEEKDK